MQSWALVPGNDGRDRRASISLDLNQPLHGRHCLRVVVPTATPLVVPFSLPYGGAFGLLLQPNQRYAVTLWARAERSGRDSDSEKLTLGIMNGTWSNTADWTDTGKYAMNFTGVVQGAVHELSMEWNSIAATVSSDHSSSSLHLRLGGGPGVIYLDNTSVVSLPTTSE